MTEFREPSAPPAPTPPPPAYSEVCPLNNRSPDPLPSTVVPSPRSKLLTFGLVALTLVLLGLLVTVVGLVLEVISLRATLGSLDRESVGEVKGSVRRLETNMHNSTKYYLVKLNSLYKRVAALEVEMSISSGNKQMLVAPEVLFTSSALSLLFSTGLSSHSSSGFFWWDHFGTGHIRAALLSPFLARRMFSLIFYPFTNI